jgi:hypothetical protein
MGRYQQHRIHQSRPSAQQIGGDRCATGVADQNCARRMELFFELFHGFSDGIDHSGSVVIACGQSHLAFGAISGAQIRRLKTLRTVGLTNDVRTHFYAISAERKLQHPAVVAIRNAARRELFN